MRYTLLGREEAGHGGVFIVIDLEERKNLGHLEGAFNLRARAKKFDFRAEPVGQLPTRDQLSQAGRIQDRHLPEVEQNLLPVLSYEFIDHISKQFIPDSDDQPAVKIHNDHVVSMPHVNFHEAILPESSTFGGNLSVIAWLRCIAYPCER